MSRETVRIGVAGLGGIGLFHAQTIRALNRGALVAVASARPERAAEVATRLDVRACTYAELLEAGDIDAVVVTARSVDHAQHGADVLRSGKHLFLEKPGATTLAAHDVLVAAAAERPELVVQIGYHRRYDPAFVELHRIVSEGRIGEPSVVLATSRDVRTPEPEAPEPTGGFLVDMAVHDYDAFCWLLGREPVEAFAARQARVYPELTELGDLDNAIVTVRFDDDGIATTHLSRTCGFGHDVRMEVVGSDGSALVGSVPGGEDVVVLTAGDRAMFPQDYQERFREAYPSELEAFVAACLGTGPPGPGVGDDRRALAIGVAARASAVDGLPREVGVDWPWVSNPS
jgi:myo-inositol 2-dehydrogenase/D-chiro-inositol 1-dehydrogenase